MVVDFGKKYSELAVPEQHFVSWLKLFQAENSLKYYFSANLENATESKIDIAFFSTRYYTVFALGVRSLGWVPASICPSKILLKTFLWHHLVAKFPGNACGLTLWAILWPNFQLLRKLCQLVAKYPANASWWICKKWKWRHHWWSNLKPIRELQLWR